MKKILWYCLISISLLVSISSYGQIIHILTDQVTGLDDRGLHEESLDLKPKEKLILPTMDTTGCRYLHLFYSWDTKDDHIITALFKKYPEYDLLYVDKNNNEDLTDDGLPLKWNLTDNSIILDIISVSDPKQVTKLIIYRKPVDTREDLSRVVDSDGSLLKEWVNMLKKFVPSFTSDGTKRTFVFDGRLTVSRGRSIINGKEYLVGLFDYSNNGLFCDSSDVMLIDINNDGKLTFSNSFGDGDNVFKLNEVFPIGNKNYKIFGISRYGEWVDLIETEEKPNQKYIKHQEEVKQELLAGGNKYEVDSTFWKKKFKTLDSEIINLSRYKGKYLLLNFWGEWCKPCVEEIQTLVDANSSFESGKLQIIGFLNTTNPDAAKRMIKAKKMIWPNIIAPKDLLEKFNVLGYPTNILIFPDGKNAIINGMISTQFFKKYVK